MDECTRQIAFSPGNTTRRITKRLAAPRRVASRRIVTKAAESTNRKCENNSSRQNICTVKPRSQLNAAKGENNETKKTIIFLFVLSLTMNG